MGDKLQAGLEPSQQGSLAQQTAAQEKAAQQGTPTVSVTNQSNTTPHAGSTTSSTTPGITPPSCAQLLTQAQTQLTRVALDGGTVNALFESLGVLGAQLQSLTQQATAVNATQSQLDAAHQQAQDLESLIAAMNTASTDANGASQNIYQLYNQAFEMQCSQTTQITQMMTQVNTAAAAANATFQKTLVYSFVAQGVLDVQKPGPQVVPPPPAPAGTPAVAPVHLNKTGVTRSGNHIIVKLDEYDTANLIAELKSADGGSTSSVVTATITGLIGSYLPALLAGSAFNPMPLITSLLKAAFQLYAAFFAGVMTEADNHKKGVSLYFAITDILAVGLVGYVVDFFNPVAGAGAVWLAAQPNLVKEQNIPGGSGSDIDCFWVIGNSF